MISTLPFKTAPAAYTAYIARCLFWRRAWLLIIPLGVIIAGVAADFRIAIIGLMLLFLIYPMMMTFTILRYATDEGLALRATANVATIDSDKITLWRTDEEDTRTPVVTATIDHVEFSKTTITIHTGPNPADIIIIPATAFTPEDISDLVYKVEGG